MPPQQCPNCGRFLRNALVAELADGPQPCPGCEVELTAAMFEVAPPAGAASVASPAGAPPPDGDEPSIRPPDLSPGEVRDDASDVLDGWDVGAGAAEIASWRDDTPPFPTDTVVVVGAAAGGALLGIVLLRRRVAGAALGGLLGALLAVLVRQLWRSPD